MPSKASEILASSRKMVKGEFEYEIRRLSMFEMVAVMGNIPDLMTLVNDLTSEDRNQAIKTLATRGDDLASRVYGVVEKGLLSPKIGEDGLKVTDLPGDDVNMLFGEIMQLAGFSQEEADQLAPLSKKGKRIR